MRARAMFTRALVVLYNTQNSHLTSLETLSTRHSRPSFSPRLNAERSATVRLLGDVLTQLKNHLAQVIHHHLITLLSHL